jgi:hypothetical protein
VGEGKGERGKGWEREKGGEGKGGRGKEGSRRKKERARASERDPEEVNAGRWHVSQHAAPMASSCAGEGRIIGAFLGAPADGGVGGSGGGGGGGGQEEGRKRRRRGSKGGSSSTPGGGGGHLGVAGMCVLLVCGLLKSGFRE